MPSRFEAGDIFATPGLRAFGHGCNCAGAMGKGIALSFKRRWPKMYREYRALCATNQFVPGDVFLWQEDGCFVFSLGTQTTWRTSATEESVRTSVSKMLKMASELGLDRVTIPAVGAGLGGLPWTRVAMILRACGDASTVELVVCEKFVADQPISTRTSGIVLAS